MQDYTVASLREDAECETNRTRVQYLEAAADFVESAIEAKNKVDYERFLSLLDEYQELKGLQEVFVRVAGKLSELIFEIYYSEENAANISIPSVNRVLGYQLMATYGVMAQHLMDSGKEAEIVWSSVILHGGKMQPRYKESGLCRLAWVIQHTVSNMHEEKSAFIAYCDEGFSLYKAGYRLADVLTDKKAKVDVDTIAECVGKCAQQYLLLQFLKKKVNKK